MIRNELIVEFDRPVEEVFAYIEDDDKVYQWIEGLLESRRTTPGEPGVGSRFHQVVELSGRRLELDGEVVAYEPDRRLAIDLRSKLCDMEVDYRFEPTAGGSRLHYVGLSKYHSFFLRLFSPLLKRAAQKKLEADFGRLQALLREEER